MKYNFFIASSWKNKDKLIPFAEKIREKGYIVFSFLDKKENFTIPVAEVMKDFTNVEDWKKHKLFKQVFSKDMKGLRESETLLLVLPAGKSAHMEAGIAHGMGRKVYLVGEPQEADTLYLIMDKFYSSMGQFVESLKNKYEEKS